ncbi:MAG: trimeric intracellular cation channel family protein [Oscillospiraceae bacterium]|nr:trimeric intracellular cation channel family protein [Oscillospiraceae bacterium]
MELYTSAVFVMEMVGTVAFALSGAAVAVREKLDLFGVVVLGIITSVGGGMIRDVLIGNIPPNMFRNPIYVTAAFITSVLLFLCFKYFPHTLNNRYVKSEKIVNFLDAIGLGIFTVVGMDTGIAAGYGEYDFLIIVLGVTTGIGGGMVRDVLAGRKPVVLQKQVYASASIAGALTYSLLLKMLPIGYAMFISAMLVTIIRVAASKYRWDLPSVKIER